MVSYAGCHVMSTYIGCIGTHAHGRQVTSLLCLNDVISRNVEYSGTSGNLLRIVVSKKTNHSCECIRITVCHHSASLVILGTDIFCPTHTLIIDSYNCHLPPPPPPHPKPSIMKVANILSD